jgi:hypothetical protein
MDIWSALKNEKMDKVVLVDKDEKIAKDVLISMFSKEQRL